MNSKFGLVLSFFPSSDLLNFLTTGKLVMGNQYFLAFENKCSKVFSWVKPFHFQYLLRNSPFLLLYASLVSS